MEAEGGASIGKSCEVFPIFFSPFHFISFVSLKPVLSVLSLID